MQDSCWPFNWWLWFISWDHQRTACWRRKADEKCSQKLPWGSGWAILPFNRHEWERSPAISWWSLPVCIWRQKFDCCWYGKRLARRSRYLPQWQEDFPYLGQWGGPTSHHLHAAGWRCSWCIWKTCQRNQSSRRLSQKGIWQRFLSGWEVRIHSLLPNQPWNWYESICPCWSSWMD